MNRTELYHHGILGQRWGVRREKDFSTYDKSNKNIKINSDGSKTIPSQFVFNRVGQSSLDVNKSGALYVSYGKDDAARYINNLGPTPLNKFLKTASYTAQSISVKSPLKVPSDETVSSISLKTLLDKNMLDEFNNSLYSLVATGNIDDSLSKADIQRALKEPMSKEAQKISYALNSILGDENFSEESKKIYQNFRDSGYDAIPDTHDRLSGTSNTAMIVINPEKVELKSTTYLTKDVMKSAKEHIKSLEKLKVSELID